jgi:hypothetical protein
MSIHGSRIVALPSSDNRTIGFSAVNLLIFDEAARVDDAVYAAARPIEDGDGTVSDCVRRSHRTAHSLDRMPRFARVVGR